MTRRIGHEVSDLSPRVAMAAIAGFLALILVAGLVAWGVTSAFRVRSPIRPPSAFDRAAAVAAGPRLEVNPRADRLALDRQAESRLSGYGWADQNRTMARIPIDRAMMLQAVQGWPDADAGSPVAARAGQSAKAGP